MEKASKLRFLFSSSSVLVLPSLFCLVYPCCNFAYATDTLLPGQILNASQSLFSKNGAFKLGCDCSVPRDGYSYCGLGIWFADPSSSSCDHDYFPLWQPDKVSRPSYNLSVSDRGVLNLIGEDYSFWSSTYVSITSISAVAVLLDNGNLVVRYQVDSSMVIWQSFDSPTSVLLPGGRLGLNTTNGNNITLVSYNHTVGISYTLYVDATISRGFVIQQDPGGRMFSGTFPRWMDIHEDGDNMLTFNVAHTYIHLNASGFIRFVELGECHSVLWSAPESVCDDPDSYCGPCDIDSYCGPDSFFTRSGSCICPVGFDPPSTEAGTWSGRGCSRKVPLNCESNVTEPEVTFCPMNGIHRYPQDNYPQDNQWLQGVSKRECESYCLNDCGCDAFAAYNTTCLILRSWRNIVVLDSDSNGNHLYIRLKQKYCTTAPLFSFQKKMDVLLGIGVLALIITGLVILWRCRRKLCKTRMVYGNGSLTVVSFAQIKKSTKNFSEKLGEGGFGFVFKGTMPDSTAVAVKKLKGIVQGDKQFRTEVQTIGMIQHTNLVRLLGFCADSRRQLLVYEYMVNGSLNSHLFSRSSAKLSWELRYHVALGIARGLAYLHEECKDCIVHCDIKPDNILLDEQFCPKIADFGMAKLLCRDFSRALTTMRGTIGYLAPEWISGLPITCKADVYSYGMMLLEIISGRRNSEKIKEGRFTYFPTYAAVRVNEGDVTCLLDSGLEDSTDAEQVKRACRVACWCIQDAEDHRPMMGQVVRVLEGIVDVQVPPVPRSLQNYVGMEDSCTLQIFTVSDDSCQSG